MTLTLHYAGALGWRKACTVSHSAMGAISGYLPGNQLNWCKKDT